MKKIIIIIACSTALVCLAQLSFASNASLPGKPLADSQLENVVGKCRRCCSYGSCGVRYIFSEDCTTDDCNVLELCGTHECWNPGEHCSGSVGPLSNCIAFPQVPCCYLPEYRCTWDGPNCDCEFYDSVGYGMGGWCWDDCE